MENTTMSTDNSSIKRLPQGQIERNDFPRFGVTSFANFSISPSPDYSFLVAGAIEEFRITHKDLETLERVEQVSDFHCVTTWSYRSASWSGFRLQDVYKQLIQPHLPEELSIAVLELRGLDKYKSSLFLEDALADGVLLADSLDGLPLGSAHGAPLRVIAPAHYGYKNVKHLAKINLLQNLADYKPRIPRFMEHPRGRIAYEERGRYFPGWFLRYLYRPLIASTVRIMNKENS
jgi:DMSO/TMAO reductase YedYZ molybdopterin-dependent catalytic subunit